MTTSNTADLLRFVELYVEEAAQEELEEAATIEHAVGMLVAVQEMRSRLAEAEKALHAFLADTLPGGTYVIEGIPGVAAVERKAASKRTAWQHHELTREVSRLARQVEHRLVDSETGEVESEAEATARMLEEAAHISYWKLTPLRAWGIPADEYVETTWGAPTIRVHKA